MVNLREGEKNMYIYTTKYSRHFFAGKMEFQK